MTIGTHRHVPTQAAALPKLLVALREAEAYLLTAPAHRTTGGTLLALVRAALAAFQKE